jgi:hypothetical protein
MYDSSQFRNWLLPPSYGSEFGEPSFGQAANEKSMFKAKDEQNHLRKEKCNPDYKR